MEIKLETEKRLAKMEQKLDNLIDDVKSIATDIKEHVRWEAEKYEKLDNKYSAKWVEKAIIAIATGLIISIVSGMFIIFVK